MASTTDTVMKNTISTCMVRTSFLSSACFNTFPLRKSRVRVELEVSTREARVDMEADSTSTTTMPISTSEREDSM